MSYGFVGVPAAVLAAAGTGVETKADGVEDATLAGEGVGLHGLDVEDAEYRQGEGESFISTFAPLLEMREEFCEVGEEGLGVGGGAGWIEMEAGVGGTIGDGVGSCGEEVVLHRLGG